MPLPAPEPQPQTAKSQRTFPRKIKAGFWLVGIVLLLLGFASYQSLREFEKIVTWVSHSQDILEHLQLVLSDVQDIEIGLRGYVITGKEHFLGPYKNGLNGLNRDRDALAAIMQKTPQDLAEHVRRLEALNILIDRKLSLLKTMLALRQGIPYLSAHMEVQMTESKEILDRIRLIVGDMQQREKTHLMARERQAGEKSQSTVRYFITGLIMELMILLWIVRQIRQEIKQRKQAHDELELRIQERTAAVIDSNERLRELSHRLMNVQETERRQIAHDLHDEIGQSLTAIKLGVREAHNMLKSSPLSTLLVDSLTILDQVIEQVRNLALDLRPSLLDELGLVPALKWYMKRQGERAGCETKYAAHLGESHLTPGVGIACFRIVQEALTNVMRHAEATHVQMSVTQQEDHLLLVIEDNGQGFNVEQAKTHARSGISIGLLGMEERAKLVGGELTITSSPKTGTRLTASLPLVGLNPHLTTSEARLA